MLAILTVFASDQHTDRELALLASVAKGDAVAVLSAIREVASHPSSHSRVI